MWSNRCCQRSLTSCRTPWMLTSLAWSLANRSSSPSRLRWLLFSVKRLISSMQSWRDRNSEPQQHSKGMFYLLTNLSQTKPWSRPSSCQNCGLALSRASYKRLNISRCLHLNLEEQRLLADPSPFSLYSYWAFVASPVFFNLALLILISHPLAVANNDGLEKQWLLSGLWLSLGHCEPIEWPLQ